MSITILADPPRRDPRTTRYSTAFVQRARELVEAGWTAGETRRLIAEEFGLDRPPAETTIRLWTEPGYRDLHRRWQLKCQDRRASRAEVPSRLTPDLLWELRVDDGLSYTAIAAIARRFFAEDLTEYQVRRRLYDLGARKNPNKARRKAAA